MDKKSTCDGYSEVVVYKRHFCFDCGREHDSFEGCDGEKDREVML